MFTKVVRGCPPEVIEKRKARIQDAMLIVGRSDDEKEKPQDIVDKD